MKTIKTIGPSTLVEKVNRAHELKLAGAEGEPAVLVAVIG